MKKWIQKLLNESTLSFAQANDGWSICEKNLSESTGIPVEDFGQEEYKVIYEELLYRFHVHPKMQEYLQLPKRNRKALKSFIKETVIAAREDVGAGAGVSGGGDLSAGGPPAEVIQNGPNTIAVHKPKGKKKGKKRKLAKKVLTLTNQKWGANVVSSLGEALNDEAFFSTLD